MLHKRCGNSSIVLVHNKQKYHKINTETKKKYFKIFIYIKAQETEFIILLYRLRSKL